MLLRALRPFTGHPDVAQVVVALSAGTLERPPAWLAELTGEALRLVPGGAERGDSVAAGLAALPETCSVVLVHDGARPFVERDTIDTVIATARRGVGAVPALVMGETLKETTVGGPGDRVVRTVPRERLWRAQTPQGFPRAMLERAYERARSGGLRATDDAALVEAAGDEVRVVPGSTRNLKVTTLEDLELAEAIVRLREQ